MVLCSRENKRIGDYAAGTIVVRDAAAGSDVLAVLVDAGRERDDGLTPDDRELVAQFLARRDDLEPAARERVAAQIGARVRPRLRASFAHLDDESLLEHLGR